MDEIFCLLDIKVKTRAKKNLGISFKKDTWVVSVSEPPINGEANDSIIRCLAKVLETPQFNISIVRGTTSSFKTLKIVGFELNEVIEKLNNII